MSRIFRDVYATVLISTIVDKQNIKYHIEVYATVLISTIVDTGFFLFVVITFMRPF